MANSHVMGAFNYLNDGYDGKATDFFYINMIGIRG